MKKILLIALMLWGVANAQSKAYLRYDSVILTKVGGNSELIVLNGSRSLIGAGMYNMGNGRTEFLNNAGDTPVLPAGFVRSGFLWYDSTGADSGLYVYHRPYWVKIGGGAGVITGLSRIPGVDSIYYTLTTGVTYAIKDSVGSGGGGGSTNTSIGGGYKVAVNGTNDIKSIIVTNGVLADSSVTGEVRLQVDSSTYRTVYSERKTVDSILAILALFPSDTTFINLNAYATPNVGYSDTTGIKTAFATAAARGKNIKVNAGDWYWPYNLTPPKGMWIVGEGDRSRINFNKDTTNCFNVINDSVRISNITFIGKGRGSAPGAEVFTFSNAIYVGASGVTVDNCKFKNVKGSAITSWVVGTTLQGNAFLLNSMDSCGVGVYMVSNSEYSKTVLNTIYHCQWAYINYCAGNFQFNGNICEYNTNGVSVYAAGGCNGDHGMINDNIVNHSATTALDIKATINELEVSSNKFYFGAVKIGSTDTARHVYMTGNVFSGNTISLTKARNVRVSGGAFGSTAVTVSGTAPVELCGIINSVYQNIVCGTTLGASTVQLAVSDSARWTGLGVANDTTANYLLTVNKVTGAIQKTNWGNNPGGGGGMTNPMTTDQDIIVGGASGTPGRLGVGSDGTFLGVSGGVVGYYTPSGAGDVLKVGTPVNNQIGVWTGDGTIEGDPNFTWDASTLAVTGNQTLSGTLQVDTVFGGTAAGSNMTFKSTTGTGTTTGIAYDFLGGTNGGTRLIQVLNNASIGINSAAVSGFNIYSKGQGSNSSTINMDLVDNGGTPLLLVNNAGDITAGKLFSNTHSFTGVMTFGSVNSALTNSIYYPVTFKHITSGTATTGLGVGINFDAENASGTNKNIGSANYVYTDATNASEDADFTLNLIRGGSLVEKFKIGASKTTLTNENAVSYGVSGALKSVYASVGNVGTGEDDLMTYTVPAGTLAQDGDYIDFVMSFSVAANSTLKVYYGATQLFSFAALSADAVYRVTGQVVRTGATTQRATFQLNGGSTVNVVGYQTPAETLSGTVVLKATGEGTSNNDIVQTLMTVKYFPSN